MKHLLLVTLALICSVTLQAQDMSIEHYKRGKYYKQVPEKKADVRVVTKVSEEGKTVEWQDIKKMTVMKFYQWDAEGMPIGFWREGKKRLNYNFTLVEELGKEFSKTEVDQESMNQIRSQSQKEFQVPRYLLKGEVSKKSWESRYWLHVVDGELEKISLIQRSGEKAIDKEGARAIQTVDFSSVLPTGSYELELPIKVAIR